MHIVNYPDDGRQTENNKQYQEANCQHVLASFMVSPFVL